jgi:hypothetical protein
VLQAHKRHFEITGWGVHSNFLGDLGPSQASDS